MRQVIQAGTRSFLYYPITRSSSIDRFVGLSLPTVQPAPHPFSSTFPLIENQPANFILSESLALCFKTMQLFSSFFLSMVTPSRGRRRRRRRRIRADVCLPPSRLHISARPALVGGAYPIHSPTEVRSWIWSLCCLLCSRLFCSSFYAACVAFRCFATIVNIWSNPSFPVVSG